MPEKFNRSAFQDRYVESMMNVNPRFVDFVHAEMVRCTSIIAAKGIVPTPSPRIVVNRKAQLQPVLFDSPNLLVINFPSIQSMDQLRQNMREAMASYAMYMMYLRQKDVHRTSLEVHKVEKPHLYLFGSAKWREALEWFTN